MLKVRGGCYNCRFKLYKWLNVATKTVCSSKFIMPKPLKWGVLGLCILNLQYDIHKMLEISISLSGPNRTSKWPSYLFSLIPLAHNVSWFMTNHYGKKLTLILEHIFGRGLKVKNNNYPNAQKNIFPIYISGLFTLKNGSIPRT